VSISALCDVALLNGIMYAIIDEDLQDDGYIAKYTEDFEQMRTFENYTPEHVAPIWY
jgi:anaerobic selenocysteine-containing dehydrogenase